MAEEKGSATDWITMKIEPYIFEELGVRDPEQIKLETKIMKKVRQVNKELKDDPKNSDKLNELATYYIDGGNYPVCADPRSTSCRRAGPAAKPPSGLPTMKMLRT